MKIVLMLSTHITLPLSKECVVEGRVLEESTVKDIHALLMENILVGGDLKPFAEMVAELEETRLDEYLAIISEQVTEDHSPTQAM